MEDKPMGTNFFGEITVGQVIDGRPMGITRETIREFAEASLDFNPLHLDSEYMAKQEFGKTKFKQVIAHGMTNFSLITRMMTEWLWPHGGIHRRLETRWLKPVYSGDTVYPKAIVSKKIKTEEGQWVLFNIEVRNQEDILVSNGEAMAEFPD
jgi:3-hydroxybutyryl-CoA dehydratase